MLTCQVKLSAKSTLWISQAGKQLMDTAVVGHGVILMFTRALYMLYM